MTTAVAGSCRVALHDLHMRADADEWIVGRRDTGEFVAVPEIAVATLLLLRDGLTVDQTRRKLMADRARDIDVVGFVESLIELGFIASIDGRQTRPVAVPKASLPGLRPHHLRWLVTWPIAAAVLVLIAVGGSVLALAPDTVPEYRDLLWSRHTSVVLATNAATAWSIIFLHELAHLLTARAFGVPGRMTLSTRLQFLVAQTDVSGIWAAPRPARLLVYLSGMVVNLAVAAAALLTRALVGTDSAAGRLAAAIVILALLPVPIQFLVFMRTDVYYVVQDIASARNLYADGSAYVLWCARRVGRIFRGTTRVQPDPSADLPARERRAVRAYAVLLAAGTAACLSVAATVTLPFALAILVTTMDGLRGSAGVAANVDAVVTTVVFVGFWALWCWAWWRRHGRRVRTWVSARAAGAAVTTPPSRGGENHGGDCHPQAGQGRDDQRQ